MRSKNTKKYANYYLLCPACEAVKNVPATTWPCKAAMLPVKYFNDYQTLLKEKYIIKLRACSTARK